MKYCQHCGAQVDEKAVVCVKCGCALSSYNIPNTPDVPSTGLNVLSFFFPIVGLILFAVYNDKAPRKAKAAGKWAIISVCISVGLSVLSFLVLSYPW